MNVMEKLQLVQKPETIDLSAQNLSIRSRFYDHKKLVRTEVQGTDPAYSGHSMTRFRRSEEGKLNLLNAIHDVFVLGGVVLIAIPVYEFFASLYQAITCAPPSCIYDSSSAAFTYSNPYLLFFGGLALIGLGSLFESEERRRERLKEEAERKEWERLHPEVVAARLKAKEERSRLNEQRGKMKSAQGRQRPGGRGDEWR